MWVRNSRWKEHWPQRSGQNSKTEGQMIHWRAGKDFDCSNQRLQQLHFVNSTLKSSRSFAGDTKKKTVTVDLDSVQMHRSRQQRHLLKEDRQNDWHLERSGKPSAIYKRTRSQGAIEREGVHSSTILTMEILMRRRSRSSVGRRDKGAISKRTVGAHCQCCR